MSRFLSGRYSELESYIPGEQPGDKRYIKLNTNESPYPPPPGVIAAVSMNELGKLNLYPNPDATGLIDKLADRYSVSPGNLICGNGSDELLAFAFQGFCDENRGIAFPDITYGFYPVFAMLYSIPYMEIPLNDDYTINVSDYISLDRNIVIANPNAPTGIALSLSEIETIIMGNPDCVVIIDEAYVDFGTESAVSLVHKYDNLLVMHTYSKSRSLAGARVAYAIGSTPLIGDMKKLKYSFNPYNVSRAAQILGAAALDAREYYDEKCREIIKTREYTTKRLRGLGFILTESAGNFVFASKPGIGGGVLYRKLKERGILVRHFDKERIKDYLRITIGTRKQMDALFAAICEIFEEAGL